MDQTTQEDSGAAPSGQALITVDSGPTSRPARAALEGATFWVSAPKPTGPAERFRAAASRPAEAAARRLAADAGQYRPPPAAAPLAGRIADSREGFGTSADRPDRSTEPSRAPAESKPPAKKSPPEHLCRGTVSRDNDRFKKEITLVDGIKVRVKDTDEDPLDADFDIVAGKFRVKPDDVPVGGRVKIRGISGRSYVLKIVWIEDHDETVHFVLDPVD